MRLVLEIGAGSILVCLSFTVRKRFTGKIFLTEVKFFFIIVSTLTYGGEFLERYIGFEVHTLHNLIGRTILLCLDKVPEDVTTMHGWMIEYLFNRQDEDVYQRDLEEHFSMRRSTVSRMLQLMERNGLVVRTSVGSDARLKKITLTPKAIAAHEQILKGREKVEQQMNKGISEQELQTFFQVLDKIKANLQP